jgi:hypothetical protein
MVSWTDNLKVCFNLHGRLSLELCQVRIRARQIVLLNEGVAITQCLYMILFRMSWFGSEIVLISALFINSPEGKELMHGSREVGFRDMVELH